MKRQELAHILRAACDIAGDRHVLVLGSQSILGTFDEDALPPAATASIEADIAFLDDPERIKADDVEGAIGEMSAFHRSNGVYAEGHGTVLSGARMEELVGGLRHPDFRSGDDAILTELGR